jgi:hypothetical protein
MLFRRTGRKVHAIGWFHDGSAKGPRQLGLGNNWVIAAVVVTLRFCSRPVALPVLAKLVHKDIKPAPASRLLLAQQMTAALVRTLPGRQIRVVADAAYAGKDLARLPASVTWTTRLRKDAALYELPGPRTGKRGRPRVKGGRLPSLAALADAAPFALVSVRRYGKAATVHAAAITCLWHGSSAPARSRSSSSATRPPAATTWRWPSTWPPAQPRSSTSTRPAGA